MSNQHNKGCRICQQGAVPSYKDPESLRAFTNRRGKILSRRISRLCAKHQRAVSREIDRARKLALLPYEEKP